MFLLVENRLLLAVQLLMCACIRPVPFHPCCSDGRDLSSDLQATATRDCLAAGELA